MFARVLQGRICVVLTASCRYVFSNISNCERLNGRHSPLRLSPLCATSVTPLPTTRSEHRMRGKRTPKIPRVQTAGLRQKPRQRHHATRPT